MRGVGHSQIRCTEFKSLKKFLGFNGFFQIFWVFRIFSDFFNFFRFFGFYWVFRYFSDFSNFFRFFEFFWIFSEFFRFFQIFPDLFEWTTPRLNEWQLHDHSTWHLSFGMSGHYTGPEAVWESQLKCTWSCAVVFKSFDEEGLVTDGVNSAGDAVSKVVQLADQTAVSIIPLAPSYFQWKRR